MFLPFSELSVQKVTRHILTFSFVYSTSDSAVNKMARFGLDRGGLISWRSSVSVTLHSSSSVGIGVHRKLQHSILCQDRNVWSNTSNPPWIVMMI